MVRELHILQKKSIPGENEIIGEKISVFLKSRYIIRILDSVETDMNQ